MTMKATAVTLTRGWALAHPHDWALIFGSPVPGYAAPHDTIRPATRARLYRCGICLQGSGESGRGARPCAAA
jgi:hypothetical protein